MTTEECPTWRDAMAARLIEGCLTARQDLALLTPRQIEVAQMLAKGYDLDEIGQHLSIEASTVGRHIEEARTRLGLRHRTELAVMAARAGLA